MTLSARAGRTGSADSHVRVGNLRLGAWVGAPERWTFVHNRRNVRYIAESGPLSLLTRVERYFAGRFVGVTKSEAWGYVVWSIVGAAVAVPEIWAAASGSDFIWPTISGTVGHLEDKWSIVALAPVALIAGACGVRKLGSACKSAVSGRPAPHRPHESLSGSVSRALDRASIDRGLP